MSVYLTDPDVLARLAAVEGLMWQNTERGAQQVARFQAAFMSFVSMLSEYGEDWPAEESPYLEDEHGQLEAAIYGAGGYSRYAVRGDGELVLWPDSTRKERVAAARAQGFRVFGG